MQAGEPLPVHLSSNVEPRPGHATLFAVDGDDASYFGSRAAAKAEDHFTVTFDTPVRLGKISVVADAVIEISEDGSVFIEVAQGSAPERDVKALRVRVRTGGESWVLRELRAESRGSVESRFAGEFLRPSVRTARPDFAGWTVPLATWN